MKINIIIPARYGSKRLEGKPLKKINGKEMIRHIVERVKPPLGKNPDIYNVIVATDDCRIKTILESYSHCEVLMSSQPFKNGTERVYWASKNTSKADVIINLQGDEPLIEFNTLIELAQATISSACGIATLCCKIENKEEVSNPNIVKLALSSESYAIYFSRSPIPYDRDNDHSFNYLKHIGIYGYTPEALDNFYSLEETELEKIEKLEQLRMLYHGHRIKVILSKQKFIGVDTKEDLIRVEKYLNKNNMIINHKE